MAIPPERMWLSESGALSASQGTELERLRRENEALLRENMELQVYRRLAYHDPLTGLGNRRYLDKRLSQERFRARRHPHQRFSVLVIDLDGFKAINDTYGHAEGDAALCFIARFFEDNLREDDICCRVGGDEFTIILPETGLEGAERIRRRLFLGLKEANEGRRLPLSFSVGLATWPEDGDDVEALLSSADADMFQAKTRRLSRP
ncbi:MAG: GGDEF domain-containing protein [Myxococcota bacterium]